VSQHNGAAAVQGIHHVEMYVANDHQASHFYRTVLGFTTLGRVPRENGHADRRTTAIQRGDVRVLLTAPLTASCEVAEHLRVHGEGIKDIAFSVSDVDAVFERAVARGAAPLMPPDFRMIGGPSSRIARIGTCGDLVHSLIGPAAPGTPWCHAVSEYPSDGVVPDTAIDGVDHVALALAAGELDRWTEFYVSALGFAETHQEQVSTEYSAMRSKVVCSPNGAVRLPMMEPASGRRKSQIDDYVASHDGPGAQHLALRSHDILQSVASMTGGLEFLPTPATYYDSLEARVGALPSDLDSLRRHGVLVDRDATGLLLQVFTKPIGARRTLFLEVIERRGAQGFGSGNIKALFEAVERLQAASGAL
jgi:4-hydroxyphenylpyruvate dioxygenase